MNKSVKYYPFGVAALLMWLVLYLIYPYYQYYIDPDGTAYLTISKRYANGDILHAINGYWSPWACWLTAGLIRLGLPAIPASVIINALGATGFLFISQSLFLKSGLGRKVQWLFNITLSLFLCYAVFWQSFDDLWECFFLLAALRMMLADNYNKRPGLWIAVGVVGTLAYFAKAYAFPFFILNTLVCTYFITADNKAQWLKISTISVGSMILLSLPWIVVLHHQYGIWTTSTSGTLNMSWYLIGHPHWKPGISLLIPPAYPDSPYYWEDPWIANGDTPHFWDSWHLLGLQTIRLGYNLFKLLRSMLEISVFFPIVAAMALLSLRVRKLATIFSGDKRMLLFSFLLFPLGYLLVNFESRYIWYMFPLGMVMGAVLLQSGYFTSRFPSNLVAVIFCLSFLVVPVLGIVRMYYYSGRKEFNAAVHLNAAGIHGAFTGNIHPRYMSRLAYFSGNTYYFLLSSPPVNEQGLMNDMHRYKIEYYLHFSALNSFQLFDQPVLFDDDRFLKNNAAQLTELKIDGLKGIQVFRVRN